MKGLRKLLGDLENVVDYVDDIIVLTETWEEHLVILQELFRRLSDAKLTARPTKCIIGSNFIEVLGHRVSEGVKGLHEKIIIITSSNHRLVKCVR